MALQEHDCLSGWKENPDGTVYRCDECFPRPQLEIAHARNDDPATSHEAAASIGPQKLSALQQFVHWCLEDHGPATDEELVAYIHTSYPNRPLTPQSIRSRRSELVRKGKVRPVPNVFRSTHAGHRAQVWEAK